MGSSHHLKRLAMPRSWPLPRKTTVWIARPRPGAHSLERCIALSVVMRDILEVADTSRKLEEFYIMVMLKLMAKL